MQRGAMRRTILGGAVGVAAMLGVAGCGGGSSSDVSGSSGRKVTVEYRPLMTGQNASIQKQRSGFLVKVTPDWVALKENTVEVWIPADMVLEIRMDPK